MYDESPAAPAKIVSASPDTIWFARRVITRNARISAQAAPASGGGTDRDGERDARRAPDVLDAEEADHRAHQHHPLDAEVEHARALREQLAERREEERRPVGDRRGEHDDDDAVVHPRRLADRRGRRPVGRSTTIR